MKQIWIGLAIGCLTLLGSPAPTALAAPYQTSQSALEDDYQNYQDMLRHQGSSRPFFRANAPARYRDWLRAAEKGNAIAELFMARCNEEGFVAPNFSAAKNETLGLKWAMLSARHGNTFAMALLGTLYDAGMKDLPKNHAEALRWYHKSAAQGNWLAMMYLGDVYADEKAAEHSYAEAMRWYRMSADAGDAFALRQIGDLFANGHMSGGKKDPVEATKWYQQAANAGNTYTTGLVMAERVSQAFKSYAAPKATAQEKLAALAVVRADLPTFSTLDFEAANVVMSNFDVTQAVDKLHESQPESSLLTIHGEMVNDYIRQYQQADVDAKLNNANTFAQITAPLIDKWFDDDKFELIATFAKKCYEGLPLATLTAEEQSELVSQLKKCVIALYQSNCERQGKQLLKNAIDLCDNILKDKNQPWDWYMKDAYMGLCFQTAATLSELKYNKEVQPLLRRAWGVALKKFGKEALLDRYPQLPLKGQIPADGSEADDEFFKTFKPGVSKKKNLMKKFDIPADFAGTKYPFYVYVLSGLNGYAELEDQFLWLEKNRGGTVPQDVRDSFAKLHKIAVVNDVDFMELCDYALSTKDKDKTIEDKKASSNR